MKVSVALNRLRQMPPDARLLVRDKDGRWLFVTDARFSYVSADGTQPPSHLLIDGVSYVRGDLAEQKGAASGAVHGGAGAAGDVHGEGEGGGVMPVRIQRKRTKGWTMPADTVYVGRPTRFGNPFTVYAPIESMLQVVARYRLWLSGDIEAFGGTVRRPTVDEIAALRGKNLACWCPLDQPCHADVLLELANR